MATSLNEFCEKFGIKPTLETEKFYASVCMSEPPPELWNLTDYKVTSVSGPVVWLKRISVVTKIVEQLKFGLFNEIGWLGFGGPQIAKLKYVIPLKDGRLRLRLSNNAIIYWRFEDSTMAEKIFIAFISY